MPVPFLGLDVSVCAEDENVGEDDSDSVGSGSEVFADFTITPEESVELVEVELVKDKVIVAIATMTPPMTIPIRTFFTFSSLYFIRLMNKKLLTKNLIMSLL